MPNVHLSEPERAEGGRRSDAGHRPTASRMIFCLFCHWRKVEPGTNCPRCNTYMPKAAPDTPGRRGRRVSPVLVRRRPTE
jgi:hypothetical protein